MNASDDDGSMTDDDELTIVVRAPAGAGALERDGMLRRLEEAVAIAVSEIAVDGYVTTGATDDDEVRLVIAATDLASPDILSLVGDSVAGLLDDPELTGWGPFSVNVTDEVGDDDALVLDWDTPTDDLPELVEFDAEAARRRLEQDATRVTDDLALPDAWSAGALFQGCVLVLDHLFMDLQTLAGEYHGTTVDELEGGALFALHELPDRYSDRYDALFTQELIVATVDVTRRFTAGWEPPACVAHELALRMIVTAARSQLEQAEVELRDDWRSGVDDVLFEDLDHEIVYDPMIDEIELQKHSPPMSFTNWFTPFSPTAALPPYLLDEPWL